MVREMEAPLAQPVTVRVDLPVDPDAAERLAERAFATVGELLGSGRPVTLITRQSDGEHSAAVTGMLDAGRRLARAVPPQPVPLQLLQPAPLQSEQPTRRDGP